MYNRLEGYQKCMRIIIKKIYKNNINIFKLILLYKLETIDILVIGSQTNVISSKKSVY